MVASLDNIKVIDVTQGVSGPLCTRNLAHMGADVVKIERPEGGDITRLWDTVANGHSSGFVYANFNKQSVAINLKTAQGQKIIKQLVKDADVFIENFVPGTVAGWGLDYESLKILNPKLVYCSISGFGQDGPFANRAAFDLIIQGESGLIPTNGTENEFAKVSLSICDISAAMYATTAILSALYYRQDHGVGQYIDIAMFDCIMNWMGYFPYMYWYKGELPKRVGVQHHTMAPYGPYVAGDDKYVIVSGSTGGRQLWVKFCEVLDCTELIDDYRFATNEMRISNRVELDRLVTRAFAKHGADVWIELLHQAGIPCGRLNTLADALNHPQAIYRNLYTEVESTLGPVKMVDFPVRSSVTENNCDLGPPVLGEHTMAVLRSLGYTEEAMEKLKAGGAIAY
ncbi:MAG: CoA transferase [Gammaproteobacteria bacterium]|nr:CoA transferase [Gammaproteobacteria bacterium]